MWLCQLILVSNEEQWWLPILLWGFLASCWSIAYGELYVLLAFLFNADYFFITQDISCNKSHEGFFFSFFFCVCIHLSWNLWDFLSVHHWYSDNCPIILSSDHSHFARSWKYLTPILRRITLKLRISKIFLLHFHFLLIFYLSKINTVIFSNTSLIVTLDSRCCDSKKLLSKW